MTQSHGDDVVPESSAGGRKPAHRDAVERESNLPTIAALRAFVLSAQYRNFSRAADELEITQSGVSRAVRSIEDATGALLFERTGHGLVLTEPGALYLTEATEILSNLGAATLRLSTFQSGSERLHIATLPSLGSRWLAPRIGRFLNANPTIELTVTASIGQFSFEASDVDAAIHYGTDAWPDSQSEFLMDEVLIPVCRPDLIVGGKADPSALLGMRLIQHSHRPTAWREWFREIGMSHPNPTAGPVFEQYQMGIEAALAGLGTILMPPFMVLEELTSGRFVPLHDVPVRSPWSYFLIYPRTKRSKVAVQKMRSWLRAEAKRTVEQTARIFVK
ncbi:LysR family transcriptional regulator [bacterium M00.F.Ca.ET.141.01.1.1]|uniref:LysR substrate-binding domain-containing protein n=1 Tax=Mesorhizobium sp. M8A.F.Ca.ET.197.01.1.1 TaxID=2563965 RepID=UPI000FDB77A2|nr:LysR substrate-binding domain-containing protein [Mesorhizobium sp. M8A.F.Ca.ET.197.01.1.1]TGR32411.1 LysR family transcriptional regulator [Mesorhizobium sp. M8A.F.Ca.ET.202.01.1.1]TGR43677.1 LysR family transcriptional regulator [bacterium M00.F.Ca.ET.199.01.1.1]TGR52983.1 LysR family transcriptional regulator [Mesorhizobium sp. M8A.F.Ca.ET.198.01.1.1]TGU40288.1 LysR family transcriptional regulator [bacterium M00.F.Ca.ET.156.01.1.1]TGV54093.1 LysR family transcriptional regulator [bacter